MEYKNIEGFDNYIVYENGDVYNIKRNKQMKSRVNNGQIKIKLSDDDGEKEFILARLIYENFYNERLLHTDIIKFKDDNKLNIHYTNLLKIHKRDIFKTSGQLLDENKKWVIINGFENYKVSEFGDVYSIKPIIGKINSCVKNEHHKIKLSNGVTNAYYILARIVYENFHNEKLLNAEIIKFKDNNKLNFHYTNLIKIHQHDMFKVDNPDLDKSKKWIFVKDYEDYMTSEFGDIYSIKSNIILKQTMSFTGYYVVNLINKNGVKILQIHRIVYNSFKGIVDNENNVIDHIDRNRLNNHIDNLREVSKSVNSSNREFLEQTKNKIFQYTLEGDLVKEWVSIKEICEKLKYDKTIVSDCYLGRTKSAYDFKWVNAGIVKDIYNFFDIKTNFGETYSNYKINKKGQIINKYNKLLRYNAATGYNSVALVSDNNIIKTLLVHRLVAMTFLLNPNNYEMVNHKDENKLNNNVDNLEWCDAKYNITYSCGKKINQIDIETNNILKTYESTRDAYRELGKIYNPNIRLVCEGKRQTAYGFKWEYVK